MHKDMYKEKPIRFQPRRYLFQELLVILHVLKTEILYSDQEEEIRLHSIICMKAKNASPRTTSQIMRKERKQSDVSPTSNISMDRMRSKVFSVLKTFMSHVMIVTFDNPRLLHQTEVHFHQSP
jgi:hypothetical protein